MARYILRLKSLIELIKLSRSVIYDRMNEKSPRYDKDFPKSFPLGGGARGWFQDEVETWLENCAAKARGEVILTKRIASTNHQNDAAPKPSIHKRPISKICTQRTSCSRSLGETLLDGEMINAKLLGYLHMATWTPVIGALLVCGIEPPTDCAEIPLEGIGLEGNALHASNRRFHEARRILARWRDMEEDEEVQTPSIEPYRFLNWCLNEDIDGDWVRLLQEVNGLKYESATVFTAARMAMLMGQH